MAGYWSLFKLIMSTLVCAFNMVNAFRTYATEIDTIRYEHNPDIVKHIRLELYRDDTHNKVNGSFSFVQDFYDMHIINWVILSRSNGRRPIIYNTTVDSCKFFDNTAKNLNPIFATVLKILKKYVRFPSKCPLKKDHEYIISGIYFDEDLMPPYLPPNNFTGVIGIIRNNTFAFKRTYITEIDSLRYEHNPDIVKHMKLNLKRDGSHNKVNGSFSFAQDFNDLHIINWVTLSRPNGRRPTIYNTTVDACKFLDNTATNLNPIFATVLQILKKYVNLPSKCPFKKDQEYTIRGVYFDENLLPPYIPPNNFTGIIGVIRKNAFGFKITVKARVVSKSKGKQGKRRK